MDDVEPIKASTLKQFYWCAIDAYIEHLKEVGDERVSVEAKQSKALEQGERLHDGSFGLRVHPMEEDSGKRILEKMKNERVTAVNHRGYQIQGAPDEVVENGDTVRIEDMKTTSWDDKQSYLQYQFPPAKFQVQIYSWMISRVPNIEVENPIVQVKRREGGDAVDWFEKEAKFDKEEVEEKIDKVLDLFDEPEKLKEYRPSVDWKCRNDDHFEKYKQIVLDD
ncbi:MAG: PD-(D/E)XK nuclease family protein [Candidatus Aenigmatarchaeota archaeon]